MMEFLTDIYTSPTFIWIYSLCLLVALALMIWSQYCSDNPEDWHDTREIDAVFKSIIFLFGPPLIVGIEHLSRLAPEVMTTLPDDQGLSILAGALFYMAGVAVGGWLLVMLLSFWIYHAGKAYLNKKKGPLCTH